MSDAAAGMAKRSRVSLESVREKIRGSMSTHHVVPTATFAKLDLSGDQNNI